MRIFESSVAELEERLEEAQLPARLDTKKDGKYTDDVRQCCIALLTHNVGVNHIANVIRVVLSLVNISAEPLPSVSFLKQMIVEGRAASLIQVGEAAQKTNNTLHNDGTAKFGKKYGSFQLSTEEQQLTISVNDVFSGAAEHTLELLKSCAEQITEACSKAGTASDAGKKLVTSIKNTMSDRQGSKNPGA